MTPAGVPGAGTPLRTAKPVIGLAVGRGTGPEGADVFERVLGALTARLPDGVAVERSSASPTRTSRSAAKGTRRGSVR
ncbi:hypothetical protein B0E37_03991 [Streptomyces sp. MH192]|nr:hypothetical protein [Streptomyces sp. MH192]MCF0099114.1 hypothetical protein [Streptomyces sp. MH191]